jgi:glycosyltransferase involved in cell wall biosynthesis
LRVLFVAHSFPRHEGDAAGGFILRLAVALRDEGISVTALAPSAPGLAAYDEISGIPVHRFRYAPRSLERLAYGGEMIREARRAGGLTLAGFLAANRAAVARASHKAQLVHAHWWFPSGLAAASVSAARPLVTTMHGTDVRMALSVRAVRPLFRYTLRRSAAVTTVSGWLARRVREVAPDVAPLVAPMPASVERFTPGDDGRREAERLLYVGRLNAQKGIEHLIRALPLTQTTARLHVVGDGPDREMLHRLAAQLGVGQRITWLGALRPDELPGQYQTATIVVVPSIDEGLGMVAVEAQLCGATVIASASGGLPDVVEDDFTGVLVPPAEPSSLAAAIDDLLRNRDRAAALALSGRQSALEKFSPRAVAARYASLYREVTGVTT